MTAARRLQMFRRLALAGAVLAAVVVVLGAWVRLTAAGLGCPDWPGCYGHVYPGQDLGAGAAFAKALHEMIHRYFASTLGLIIVTLAAWSVIQRRDPDQPRAVPLALLVIVCLQGTLGALTVTLLLTPLIVTAHLLGGLTTLALLRWLSIAPAEGELTGAERGLRGLAVVAAGVLVMQLALGGWTSTNYAAVACPDFPTCQNSWWPQMDYADGFRPSHGLGIDYEGGILAGPARVAIHFTHRLGAAVAGSTLLLLAAVTWRRARSRRLRRIALGLGAAVCLQISLGVATVVWGVPLPVATLHNAGAALLVVMMVTLLRALWPSPAAAMVTLRDVQPAR
jgi:cytochrome c oxidase assembly protein subunit 15